MIKNWLKIPKCHLCQQSGGTTHMKGLQTFQSVFHQTSEMTKAACEREVRSAEAGKVAEVIKLSTSLVSSLIKGQITRIKPVYLFVYFGCTGQSLLHGLFLQLRAVASLVAEHELWSTDSVVSDQRLSCSLACGIFLDQGSNLCLLHWQVNYLPQSHQGNPQGQKNNIGKGCFIH